MASPARFASIFAAVLALAPFSAHGQGGAWVARRLPWYGLPNRELIGSSPTAAINLPAARGACGALSDTIDPFAARGPVVLKVTIRVDSGAATVSVRDEDGTSLLSRARTLASKDGEAIIYIGVEPGESPRAIALCNAGDDGAPAQVEVLAVEAAKTDAIGADDMARVNLGML